MCGLVFVMPHRVSVNVSMSHVEAKLAFHLFSHSVHVLSVKKKNHCNSKNMCKMDDSYASLLEYVYFGGS